MRPLCYSLYLHVSVEIFFFIARSGVMKGLKCIDGFFNCRK